MAIPMANITAPRTAELVAIAVPIAKPTESPSGMLWTVIAANSLKAQASFSVLLREISLKDVKSKKTINTAPIKNPMETGMNARLPQQTPEHSKEGTSSDQNDAESIIPEANPIASKFKSFDSFLKKKIVNAPKVVARQGRVNAKVMATA